MLGAAEERMQEITKSLESKPLKEIHGSRKWLNIFAVMPKQSYRKKW